MKLTKKALERRLVVWKALSDLFLDAELDQSDFKFIANSIRESGYSTLEAQAVLWEEVFPALADNLRIATGEWAYFSDEWLKKRILGVKNGTEKAFGSYGLITISQAKKVISKDWNEVQKFLDNN